MNITADTVKQLRERTGAGMMECKKALVETKGDLDAAAELMRKTGLAKADKKAAPSAAGTAQRSWKSIVKRISLPGARSSRPLRRNLPGRPWRTRRPLSRHCW